MSFAPSFKVNDIVTNEQIWKEFKCGNASGIRPSNTTNTLVVISKTAKALYDDKWFDDELHYTGMGQVGDQELKGENLKLAESGTNGIEIHLFEVLKPKQYTYRGVVELCGDPYQEKQSDINGDMRNVWIFPLRLTSGGVIIDEDSFVAHVKEQEKSVKKLSKEELKARAEARSSAKAAYRNVITKTYSREKHVSEFAKVRAAGVCQLCGQPAPFNDAKGEPYLEVHHIVWLANGGADSIENTVALCPNCHRKMHVVNDPCDVKKLQELNS